jgi:rfaE bifunctional protein nucleotidyltransferase chain/domain
MENIYMRICVECTMLVSYLILLTKWLENIHETCEKIYLFLWPTVQNRKCGDFQSQFILIGNMEPLQSIESKVFRNFHHFEPILEEWKNQGLILVFTNGCFDLVHRGHVEYLAKAAGKGDKLIIGLNSDASVTLLKGEGRPLTDEFSRALLLAAFSFVDAVVIFKEETPLLLIEKILPDFLVKGNDYRIDEIAGYQTVIAHGGKVETIDLVAGFSTSSLIKKFRTPEA